MFQISFQQAKAYLDAGEDRMAVACFRFRVLYTWRAIQSIGWLGWCHEQGRGVPRDPYTALLWYRYALLKCSKKSESAWIEQRLQRLEQENPTPKHGSVVRFEDALCGTIVSRYEEPSCRCSFLEDHAVCNLPSGVPYDMAATYLHEEHKEREFKRYHEGSPTPPDRIDETFRRDFPHFRLRIERGTGVRYSHRQEGDCYTMILPAAANCDQLITREAIMAYGTKLMIEAAKAYLLPRLAYWSEQTGLKYNSSGISRARNHFGICYTGQKRILFSCHLIKYSDLKIDSVIIHELCHTKVSGHDNAFYDFLGRHTTRAQYRKDTNSIPESVPYDL